MSELTQFVCFETDEEIPEVVWQDYGRIVRSGATTQCPRCGERNWNMLYTERNVTHNVWLMKQQCNSCSSTFDMSTDLGV